MIEIRPDPKHPRGGFAEVTIDGASAPDGPVLVSVFNSYQQKWLGPGGWQANRAELPARSAVQEGGALRLILGPDVVNQIEEDTPIRLEVGAQSWDTYWPDDINAGPDEAVVGDIGGTGHEPEAKSPTTVAAPPPPTPEEETLSGAAAAEEDADDDEEFDDEEYEEDNEPRRQSILPVILGGLVLAAALAVLAFYFLFQPGDDATPAPRPETAAAPAPEPAADDCAANAVGALQSGGFAPVAGKVRDCGNSLSADSVLGFVEKASAANDPDALNLFGALYDSGVTDEVIETTIGLSFSDQPARAAEYYARAVSAGSTEAATRLQAVCRRLLLNSDTLSQSAREDYCQ